MGGKIWEFYLVFLFVAAVHGGDTEAITMMGAPGYQNQRDCAKYCFMGNARGNIFGQLSCSQNHCLCRDDLVGDAHSAISSCIITQQCGTTNTVDLSLGVSFFDGYCSSYHAGVSAPATLTVMDGTPATSSPPRSTVTVTVSSSSSSRILSPSSPPSSVTSTAAGSIVTTSDPTTAPSSITNSSNTRSDNTENSEGLGRQDILTIIFGVLAVIVAISVGIWQGRNDSKTRRKLREWRGHTPSSVTVRAAVEQVGSEYRSASRHGAR